MTWLEWRGHCMRHHHEVNADAVLYMAIREMHTELVERLDRIEKGEQKMAIALSDLAKVEAAEREDLATLTGLVTQLLAAVASGQLDQTAAQALLDSMSADDSTVKSNIAAIQAALPAPPSPAPATGGATPPTA